MKTLIPPSSRSFLSVWPYRKTMSASANVSVPTFFGRVNNLLGLYVPVLATPLELPVENYK